MNALFFLFVCYLLSPKIDLITLAGAAIRPEDFISLVALLIYLNKKNRRPVHIPPWVRSYIVLIILGLISALVNFQREGAVSMLFGVRLIQYLVWFFIIFESSATLNPRVMRASFLLLSSIFILWGGLEYFGFIEKIGKFAGASQRLTINTTGPFETSVMLAILAYATPQAAVGSILVIMIYLTQARVTVLAAVTSFLAMRPGRGLVIAIVGGIMAMAIAAPLMSLLKESRFAESQSPVAMVQLLADGWRKVPAVEDPAYYRDRFLTGDTLFHYLYDTDGDLSFKMRAVRWPLVVKSTLYSPIHFVIGWGPGAWGVALDSYYVRIFGETGILGLAAFLWWLITMFRGLHREGTAKFTVVMMAIVAVFIDIFTSSKVMPLLWAFVALEHARHISAFPKLYAQRRRQRVLPSPTLAHQQSSAEAGA
jgi:hypothetical protein